MDWIGILAGPVVTVVNEVIKAISGNGGGGGGGGDNGGVSRAELDEHMRQANERREKEKAELVKTMNEQAETLAKQRKEEFDKQQAEMQEQLKAMGEDNKAAKEQAARELQSLRTKFDADLTAMKKKSEEDIKNAVANHEKEKERKAREELKKRMEAAIKKLNLDPKRVNVGVVGNTGAGKSTFINSFLGLEGSEAAATGFTQTTHVAKQYKSASTNMSLWDLPGAGTQDHPLETYYQDKGLLAFACVIIVMSDRVHESDLSLAQNLLQNKKTVFFVRTRADVNLDTAAGDHLKNAKDKTDFRDVPENDQAKLKEDLKKKIINDFENIEVRRYGLAVYKPKLFIVSRWGLIKTESPYAMDEKLLAKAIAEQVAERADVATTMG